MIGPQGILDVADMTATQEAPFGGIDQVGKQVRLEWEFEGETIYSIRPLSS